MKLSLTSERVVDLRDIISAARTERIRVATDPNYRDALLLDDCHLAVAAALDELRGLLCSIAGIDETTGARIEHASTNAPGGQA